MFRKNKKENKSKLEHKLYLARENPEPVFDLSDCGIRNVPSGIYSLCRVFLKESLHLEHNLLSSLSGGGNLKDLQNLKVLDVQDNAFVYIPDEIELLVNLMELYFNDNQIKKIPSSLCNLRKLKILNVSNNVLKKLPDDIGNLISLQKLIITGNSINHLPKSICNAQRLRDIQVNAANFVYPPADVVERGTEFIMKYICEDSGCTYVGPDNFTESLDFTDEKDTTDSCEDNFKDKIRKLEKIKEQRLQDFIEIEKNNELLHRQEFELATILKANREKLLTDLSEQQSRFDLELCKIQQIKDAERFRLIEQLQEAEHNADLAVTQLLALNQEPAIQLLEQEKLEEERLLAAANKHNEALRKDDVLTCMQQLLEQETEKFAQYHENRSQTTRSILEQEMQSNSHLSNILHDQELHKAELVSQLQQDVELQMVAVGTLLERGDARSWGLIQQVRLVESQLAALTTIELNRQKLKMDEHLTDLELKRSYLSKLLMDLLHQQEQRRAQLLFTLRVMEQQCNSEDFWLYQYQQLFERMPSSIRDVQKNMDPKLSQALLMQGVLHCLPLLANLIQTKEKISDITEKEIQEAGITNIDERQKVLDAFQMYLKEQVHLLNEASTVSPIHEASAPVAEISQNITTGECVVCMEVNCEVIFVPCGHLCCCTNCTNAVLNCPLCRATITAKIKVYSN